MLFYLYRYAFWGWAVGTGVRFIVPKRFSYFAEKFRSLSWRNTNCNSPTCTLGSGVGKFSSVHSGISAPRKAHMPSTPSLTSLPSDALESVWFHSQLPCKKIKSHEREHQLPFLSLRDRMMPLHAYNAYIHPWNLQFQTAAPLLTKTCFPGSEDALISRNYCISTSPGWLCFSTAEWFLTCACL